MLELDLQVMWSLFSKSKMKDKQKVKIMQDESSVQVEALSYKYDHLN